MLAALALAAVGATACAPLPTPGPRLATGDAPGDGPSREEMPDLSTPPDWVAPTSDVRWGPCPGTGDALPPEIDLGCSRQDSTTLVRVATDRTPADAPPLVVVAGPELPAEQVAVRLVGAGPEIVDAHPVVVVDHRGRGGPAGRCLGPSSRRTLDHLADRDTDPGDPETRGALADVAQECTDRLAGAELDASSVSAAHDLESLRLTWGVPGLAVLGIGSGARTALRYAGQQPGRVSLLVLDSPAPTSGDQEAEARAALDGSDAALRLWAASCTRPECGAGDAAAKVDAVSRALDTARDPGAPVPAALLADVVRSALADLSGASAGAATRGDEILGDLVGAAEDEIPRSVRQRASELSADSLPYVAGCSDLSRRVPVNRVTELADEWSEHPPFGEILAAQLSVCSTWPVPQPVPVELPGAAPVLLVGGIADPVAGAAPVEPTAGLLTAAGAPVVRTVTWGAPGSRVVFHSACARAAVAGFLADPAEGERSSACPA